MHHATLDNHIAGAAYSLNGLAICGLIVLDVVGGGLRCQECELARNDD